MKKILLSIGIISLVAAGTFVPGSSKLEAAGCKQACTKYRSCTVSFWKKKGHRISTKQKRSLFAGCMNACRKQRRKVLACYAKSKNSCPAYSACILKAYR